MLGTFANQAALAVRNVQQTTALDPLRRLTRQVDQLEALSEVGKAVGSSSTSNEVLSTIVSHAVELSETDGGSLMEYDEETRLFRVRAAHGTSHAVLDRCEAPGSTSTRPGGPVRAPDPVPDRGPRTVDRDAHLEILYAAGWRSLVAVPLLQPRPSRRRFVVRGATRAVQSTRYATCSPPSPASPPSP